MEFATSKPGGACGKTAGVANKVLGCTAHQNLKPPGKPGACKILLHRLARCSSTLGEFREPAHRVKCCKRRIWRVHLVYCIDPVDKADWMSPFRLRLRGATCSCDHFTSVVLARPVWHCGIGGCPLAWYSADANCSTWCHMFLYHSSVLALGMAWWVHSTFCCGLVGHWICAGLRHIGTGAGRPRSARCTWITAWSEKTDQSNWMSQTYGWISGERKT